MGYITTFTDYKIKIINEEKFDTIIKNMNNSMKNDNYDGFETWYSEWYKVEKEGILYAELQDDSGKFYELEQFGKMFSGCFKGYIEWSGEEYDDIGIIEFDGKGKYRIRMGFIEYEDSKWEV